MRLLDTAGGGSGFASGLGGELLARGLATCGLASGLCSEESVVALVSSSDGEVEWIDRMQWQGLRKTYALYEPSRR